MCVVDNKHTQNIFHSGIYAENYIFVRTRGKNVQKYVDKWTVRHTNNKNLNKRTECKKFVIWLIVSSLHFQSMHIVWNAMKTICTERNQYCTKCHDLSHCHFWYSWVCWESRHSHFIIHFLLSVCVFACLRRLLLFFFCSCAVMPVCSENANNFHFRTTNFLTFAVDFRIV